jgi:hypothetical protein
MTTATPTGPRWGSSSARRRWSSTWSASGSTPTRS